MPDGSKGFTISGLDTASDDDKLPQRERIIDAVGTAGVKFWADPDGHAFATVPVDIERPDGAVMHLRVRGRRFALICRKLYGLANPVTTPTGTRPGSASDSAMGEAIPAFEAMAIGEEDTRTPGVRLIESDGAIWIDLGDRTYSAVRVTAKGWTIQTRADVPLVRSDGMRALPVPKRDRNSLAELRRLLNVANGEAGDADFRLMVAWLVASLHPSGPYPIIAVDGEQGSGKTTTCRMLRRLVDPNAADLRAMPRNEDDLLIAAQNGRIVAIDNVSYVEADMADALCRVATGAGFSKRTLYSNMDETIVSVCRPVLLNGIPSLLARGDLADRSIAVTLPPIPDNRRKPETAVWTEFEAAAPGIFALLLDGLVMALQNLPKLKLDRLPRMADFARLACAAAPAFGWTQDQMLAAIEHNRRVAVETVVEADPVAEAVQAIAHDYQAGWTGTASELLDVINMRVAEAIRNERGWPKDAARLSARLKRVMPPLRRSGVEVETIREPGTGKRTIHVTPARKAEEPQPAPARPPASTGDARDPDPLSAGGEAAWEGIL